MKITVRTLSIAAATAFALALTAGSAGATTVSPAGDSFQATGGTATFISSNGTGTDVTCPSTLTTGILPGPSTASPPNAGPAYQYNSLAGTTSGGPNGTTPVSGEVIGPISTIQFGNGNPSNNCTAAGGAITGVSVDTTAQEGRWTLTSDADPPIDTAGGTLALASVNIPPDAVTITIVPGDTLTVPDDAAAMAANHGVAASASGTFINGTNSTTNPSQLCIRSQIPFTASFTGLTSQGVEYADGTTVDGIPTTCATVTDTTNSASAITITTP